MDSHSKRRTLNIMQWNCQSLKPKLTGFKALLDQEKIHIAILSETWLDEQFDFNVTGYNIFRKDRLDGYGGVAIIVICNIDVNNVGMEIVFVKVLNCCNLENIISVYCPSSVRTTQADWDGIFSKFGKSSIIAGDFNGHHTNWANKCDARGNQLQDACLESGLISMNDGKATRVKLNQNRLQETSPDVTFVSSNIAVDIIWQVTSESLNSDHLVIKYTVNYDEKLQFSQKRNFKKADWSSYRVTLQKLFHTPMKIQSIQQTYNSFIEKVNDAANKHIPMIKNCTSPKSKFKPKSYWCTSISEAVAQRRLALGIFRRNPTPDNLYKLEEKILKSKNIISRYKSLDWQKLCDSISEETSAPAMWDKMRWVKGYKKRQFHASHLQKIELLRKLAPDHVVPSMPELKSRNNELESAFTWQKLIVC